MTAPRAIRCPACKAAVPEAELRPLVAYIIDRAVPVAIKTYLAVAALQARAAATKGAP